MQSYSIGGNEDVSLFCIGNYPEILVMDPFTLEIILTLSSKVHPDWISTIHVLRPARRQGIYMQCFVHVGTNLQIQYSFHTVFIADDVVLGLTTSGVVKVWTVCAQDFSHPEPVLEHESKQIRCFNATSMTCCLYNQRTVIIVNPKSWQVRRLLEQSISFPVGENALCRFTTRAIFRCSALWKPKKANRG